MNHFNNLKLAEAKRMWYIFLAFLVSGVAGIAVGLSLVLMVGWRLDSGPNFYSTIGKIFSISIAVFVTFFVARKLTALVCEKVKLPCPLCHQATLEEQHTLQCQPVKYECKHCRSVYRGGKLVTK